MVLHPPPGGVPYGSKGSLDPGTVAARLDPPQFGDGVAGDRRSKNKRGSQPGLCRPRLEVDADNQAPSRLDLFVVTKGRAGELVLDEAVFDGGNGAALFENLHHVAGNRGFQPVGQRLDVVRAAERVDDVGNAGFMRQDLLRAQGKMGRFLGGQAVRFVPG